MQLRYDYYIQQIRGNQMKTISTFFIAMLLIASNALADGENNYLKASYSAYSTNDSNIVLAGGLSDESLYTATNLNIAEGTSETFQLEVDNKTELLDVQMNTTARLVYYFTNKKVTIYEFGATTALRTISIDNDSPFFGVSSDGMKIYSYDNKQDYVSIFDATNGERLDRFFVNSFADNYKLGFFNSDKDEFWLKNGTELYVWSIEQKTQVGNITIPDKSKNFKFVNYGNNLVYSVEGELVLTKSSDGDKIYSKDFELSDIDSYDFSPNMNYVVVSDFSTFIVYDLIEHEIKVDSRNPNVVDQNLPFYLYANNDFSKVVAREDVNLYCSRSLESPITDYTYYIYNAENHNKIVSAPFGHIPRPENAIVSKDSKLLLLSGENLYGHITNALVDSEENFIKYINVGGYPVTFLEDNNRIAFMEGGKFKVYNIETEQYEREFETGVLDYSEVYYFANGDGRLVITNDVEIIVYDYTTFNILYTFNYSQLGIEPTDISFDNNSTINVYSLKRIHKFNAYTGESSDTPITNMDPTNKLVDVSISGRYLLFKKESNEFMVYDSEMKNELYSKDLSGIGHDIKTLSAGFYGNHEIMWIRFENNPIDRDPVVVIYDFVADKTEEMFGDQEPIISNDGSLYYSHYCPTKYEIGTIRDPQTSVETTTAITGSVYPNPASDFIKLDLNASSLNSSVEIYDAYGKQVMSVIYTGEDIDISILTAGVYFVKTGARTHKFVKM